LPISFSEVRQSGGHTIVDFFSGVPPYYASLKLFHLRTPSRSNKKNP